MAWRLSEWVLDGELDNTILGWTIGWVRLLDREEPLRLKLVGNCHADLAGWRFRIVRTDPIPDWVGPRDFARLATDQSGTIGDVTADQMLQHYECSVEEFADRSDSGNLPPSCLRMALYLEWFSNRNGRVVIQSTRLAVERIGDRAFELTEEQLAEQVKQQSKEMDYFMVQLADAANRTRNSKPNESTH